MLGLILVMLAGFFFCFQNVIVRVLFNEYDLFGLLQTGGFVSANLQNSFLLLGMRMAVGVPLMALLNPLLYPPTWKAIRQLGERNHRQELRLALVSGLLMFTYLALLYVSIGLIPTGIALTLFFTYPVFTALISWRLFGSRPSGFRWLIMGMILSGSVLTIPQDIHVSDHVGLGVSFGLASGLAYALYAVTAQKCFESFHPIPFTWISFATTLVLSLGCLLLWHGSLSGLPWTALWIGGLLSAIATFTGHILNNLGIRQVGATTAAMIGAANPALTAILAWFAIQESLNFLQVMGILIVTISVGLLSRAHQTAKQST